MRWIINCLFVLSGLSPHALALQEGSRLGEFRSVAGTRVSLRVPAGFTISPSFPGFMNVETGSALMITEFETPYLELIPGLEKKRESDKLGMVLVMAKALPLGELSGKLFEFDQSVQDKAVKKWIWVIGDSTRSVMVVGTCLAENGDLEFDLLGAAVRSSKWAPDSELNRQEASPYRLDDVGGLQLMQLMTGALMFNTDGQVDMDGKEGKPFFMVIPSLRPTPIEPRTYANRRLRMIPTHEQIRPGAFEEIQIDGLHGYASLASAIHKSSGEPSFIYQVMLFQGSSYWILAGLGRERDQKQYLPIFERMGGSFRREMDSLRSVDGLTEISVPRNWTLRSGLNEDADLQAGHAIGSNFVILLTERKSDFASDYGYLQHREATSYWIEEGSQSTTEPVQFVLHSRPAVRQLYRAKSEESPLAYLHVVVEGKEHFHQLIFWCEDASLEYSLPDFERALASFKELP